MYGRDRHKVAGMRRKPKSATSSYFGHASIATIVLSCYVLVSFGIAPTKGSVPLPSLPAPDCDANPCVALTFDDGPGPFTPKLLDILRDRNTKATFFLIGGKLPGDFGVVRRMAADGHEIGNHSVHHFEMTHLSRPSTFMEWYLTSRMLESIIGYRPTIARPPYGAANNVTHEEMARVGMASILWSVDPRDWADKDSELVCNRVVDDAHPGAILLLHDIHPTSVDATPCIIDRLTEQGYQFTTVTELLGATEPGKSYRFRK